MVYLGLNFKLRAHLNVVSVEYTEIQNFVFVVQLRKPALTLDYCDVEKQEV